MDTQHNNNGVSLADSNGSGFDPNSTEPAKTEISECEKFESLGSAIDEAVEKISLLGASTGASEICARKIEENGHDHEIEGKGESKSESESEEPESATSSSSSSSSSSGESSSGDSDSDSDCDDDDDDDDDEEEEEEEEEEKGEEGKAQGDADVEVEEDEIEGSDHDDGDDDGDKMVSWSINDDDDDDVDVIDGDDEADAAGGGPIRSKNELEDLPPVPPVNVTLEQHHQMLPVGVVMSVLGAKVIVEGVEKHDPLSEGSILWMTKSRKPLGLVDEIFGPVKNPYYVVRYNSENEVPTEIQGGTLISFVPEFANHVLHNKDLYKKGYDASGANDEELSDEVEFSDDEKEVEYRRVRRMAKRGTNDQNPGKRKNNRKKVSPKENAAPTICNAPVAPTIPDAPTAPLLNHGNCLPFSGIGQGLFGGTTAFPPFAVPPSNAGPNFATNGVWTNGTALPQQPQSSLLPNAFPTNGITWYPRNTQFSHQLPLPGVPFQQQLPLSQRAMLPGVQPNIFAQQLLYAQGLVGQNQMTFGLNPPLPQIQPPMCAAQQGFPSSELQQSERNLNMHSGTNPGGPQFHPGASASNGRKPFHGAGRGRKGRRPAK